MDSPEYILSVVLFGAVAATVYSIFELYDPYWRTVRNRVDDLLTDDAADSPPDAASAPRSTNSVGRLLGRIHGADPSQSIDRSPLQARLERGGFHRPSAVAKYLAARLLLAAVGIFVALGLGLLGYLPTEWALPLACAMGGTGAIAPRLWLDRQIADRQVRLNRSLPDFLDLMTVCLEGGLSFQESIRRVSDELHLAHSSLVAELRLVQRDIDLGATVDQALKRFANRANSEGARTLSTFVREAQRFGTNITEALRSHADMLRSQREQAAEEKAQKAAVKILIPTLLLIFPAIFVVAVGPAIIQIHAAFATP